MTSSRVSYNTLVIGKEYIIYRPADDKFNTYWKGNFCGEYLSYFNAPCLIFDNCVRTVDINSGVLSTHGIMNYANWKNRVDFRKTNIFHDLELVKENSKRARESMEQRALYIILKRLINEHFEW
jgi:hypothetical protein